MKSVGIIGGIGPESTIDYYRGIVAGYRRQRPDDYPSILINSVSVTKLLYWMDRNQLGEVIEYLLAALQRLAAAGASFGIIAANTPHIVFDELQQRSPIPLISIVEATCAEADSRAIRTVALLGTRFTMQASFYPRVFSAKGIALVVPQADEQTWLHEKYVGELLANKFLPETREQLLAIVQRMKEQQQIQGVILGGTELPLLLTDDMASGIPLLDTTRIHVQAVVAQLLA